MKKFHYHTRNPLKGPHLLGSLLIAAGLFALISPFIFELQVSLERTLAVGISANMIGTFILLTYSGTIIDCAQKRYKEYQAIGGFKSGSWKELPSINKIEIRSQTFQGRNTPNGISPTLSGKVTVFEIRLQNKDLKAVFSFPYESQSQAETQARKLAKGLNAELITL